jgi:hypothetical protein
MLRGMACDPLISTGESKAGAGRGTEGLKSGAYLDVSKSAGLVDGLARARVHDSERWWPLAPSSRWAADEREGA